MLKYCSEDCQVEHWKLVHKKHCKELAAAKKEESEGKNMFQTSVGIFSKHPFPLNGLPGDIREALLICAQKILEKMRSIKHPVFSSLPTKMKDLGHRLVVSRQSIWFHRKLGVPDTPSPFRSLFTALCSVVSRETDPLGLLPSFIFFLGRLNEHLTLFHFKSLKQPREAVPEELWESLDETSIEIFTSRLGVLVKALGGAQFPSFEELLKIHCGGSLDQACSFCSSPMLVAAVLGEVEEVSTPSAMILPGLPPLFSCGAFPCNVQMEDKFDAWAKWSWAVTTTYVKLEKNRCDSCFMRASQVHRSLKR